MLDSIDILDKFPGTGVVQAAKGLHVGHSRAIELKNDHGGTEVSFRYRRGRDVRHFDVKFNTHTIYVTRTL